MGRPPDTEKRRDLARRAVEIFQADGLDVPMSRLADSLGVKRPTLLYHFPSRAHIAELALEELLTDQASFVISRMLEHDHPIDQLYAQVRAVHEYHHGRESRLLFLSQAIASSGSERMAEIIDVGHRVFAPYRRAAVERLREGMARGTVAPCDPEALVALVRAVIDGLMVQRVMTGIELAPVHELLWSQVLKPLKRTPGQADPSQTDSIEGDRGKS